MARDEKRPKKNGTKLPLPENLPGDTEAYAPKKTARAEARHLEPYGGEGAADGTTLDRLWEIVEARRQAGDVHSSHSARLLARGTAKVAQKFGEESVELIIEAVAGHREHIVSESADVLYHLMVLWVDAGLRPEAVWAELRRRQGISGLAEKAARPKQPVRFAATSKLP